MAYPSTLTSFSNPQPTDRLNSPSHSSIETTQNTALSELQTYIGVNTGANASVVGTLLYDIKSPSSDGGGHIQSADKGGTGQVSFMKGDILVAQSSSVLTKLSVGLDGQALVSNSNTATGVNWGSVTGLPQPATTLIPLSAIANDATTQDTTPASTAGTVGLVTFPLPIVASMITVKVGEVISDSNSFDIALFSQDGQSRLFNVTTPVISTPCILSSAYVTPPASIVAGNYYIWVNANTNADVSLVHRKIDATSTNKYASILGLAFVGGRAPMQGRVSIQSGIPRTSFNPSTEITSVVSGAAGTLLFRIDG